jgi:hypothetical protein
MWMDAYVAHTLIRQQVAESDRTAAIRHLVRIAATSRPARPWRGALQRFVRIAAASCVRRPAERVVVR